MKRFGSFEKEVGGNEGQKCQYSTRIDTYGCGCAHDCSYCYAKSLLSFRDLWNPKNPSVADIDQIRRAIRYGTDGQVQIIAPFIRKNKADIVYEGTMLGVPYDLTWSCYDGGEHPCGKCGTCIDRKKAFEANGLTDPVQ